MRRRIAKKILGLRKEMRAMFGVARRGRGWRIAAWHRGWRIDCYTWKQIHDAHACIVRTERRHGFPSKWS